MAGSNEYRYQEVVFISMFVWLIHRGPLFVDDSDPISSSRNSWRHRGVESRAPTIKQLLNLLTAIASTITGFNNGKLVRVQQ